MGLLAEHPAVGGLVQPVVEVPVGDVRERTLAVGELQLAQRGPLHAFLQGVAVRLQPGVFAGELGFCCYLHTLSILNNLKP